MEARAHEAALLDRKFGPVVAPARSGIRGPAPVAPEPAAPGPAARARARAALEPAAPELEEVEALQEELFGNAFAGEGAEKLEPLAAGEPKHPARLAGPPKTRNLPPLADSSGEESFMDQDSWIEVDRIRSRHIPDHPLRTTSDSKCRQLAKFFESRGRRGEGGTL
eukprot:906534-Pyramimonas_sp.AAC.2